MKFLSPSDDGYYKLYTYVELDDVAGLRREISQDKFNTEEFVEIFKYAKRTFDPGAVLVVSKNKKYVQEAYVILSYFTKDYHTGPLVSGCHGDFEKQFRDEYWFTVVQYRPY